MVTSNKLKAIVHVSKGHDAENLKRLALFFDEIHYLLPEMVVISEEALKDPKRCERSSDGTLVVRDFNFFRDTWRPFSLVRESLDNELKDILSLFEEHGIAKEFSKDSLGQAGNDAYVDYIRNLLISSDISDEEFNRLSGTSPEDYDLRKLLTRIVLANQEGVEHTIYHVAEPKTVADSYRITTSLYFSDAAQYFPVFLNPRHRQELEYRYKQYMDGLQILHKYAPDTLSPADFRTRLGEVAFNVANSVFSSELISAKSPEDIIKYRGAMEEARRRFLSNDLLEMASIANDKPWGTQTKSEIEKYVLSKLNSDLTEYDAKSREIWEKLYGGIVVHLAEISKSLAIGGSAGGLLGNVIPNTSTWQMLLLGALAVASKETPKVVKDIVDAIIETRKVKRSSIAYIAKFK